MSFGRVAPRVLRWLAGGPAGPRGSRLTRQVFLRLLGLVYLSAFASLLAQQRGLIGARGLLPAADFLQRVAAVLGPKAPLELPTLAWLGARDAALDGLAWAGAAAAAAVVAGLAQAPALLVAWVAYLSLVNVGQDFLSFQWDTLLLETGFLALFLAPLHLAPRRPASEAEPSPAVVWLLRLLLFKLMLSSGLTKLTWHDPTWWDLSALRYHYWTQPIPAPGAWLAARLPAWLQELSCLLMYVIEIGLAPLILGPRRLRLVAFTGLVALQALIAATGNYGFFNALSVGLCVLLLDDARWPGWLRRPLLDSAAAPPQPSRWRAAVTAPLCAAVVALAIPALLETLNLENGAPGGVLARAQRAVRPFGIANDYGLFRVMTTTRPEIDVQVRQRGGEWRSVAFRYKPGDVSGAPRWFAPHMPRLDWLMWFAALDAEQLLPHGEAGAGYLIERRHLWLAALCRRVLEAEPSVLALLRDASLDAAPPDELRLVLWQYRFAPAGSPDWWQRTRVGVLWGPVALPRGAAPEDG